jgi:hypothetical protein
VNVGHIIALHWNEPLKSLRAKGSFKRSGMQFSEPKDCYEFAFNDASRRRAVPAHLRSAARVCLSDPEQLTARGRRFEIEPKYEERNS